MKNNRVLVGMSGGVDSSVTAAILKEQGYDVHGVFIEAYNEPGCRTDQDKKDALQVALKLGIPFAVLDYRTEYRELVVGYLLDEYRAGRTPNPDIVCNREVKFGLLYKHMRDQGFDYLATGHYARVSVQRTAYSVQHALQRPVDLSKDQTYFLWQVGRDKLDRVLLPLGDKQKSEVRTRARELQLPNADKPDSMGVCMLGELNMREFLEQRLGKKPGLVTWRGMVVGEHPGLWFFTEGSRGGWKLNQKSEINNQKVDMTNLPPLYVTRKDTKANVLEVGVREECYKRELSVDSKQWTGIVENKNLWVRIRNLGELVSVSTQYVVHGTQLMVVETSEPVFAPAPGQSAVFYDEQGCVVGGGIIGDST